MDSETVGRLDLKGPMKEFTEVPRAATQHAINVALILFEVSLFKQQI
jgi:hypothetical protein